MVTQPKTLIDDYPSRVRSGPGLLDRQHPTAWGDPGDGPLSPEQFRSFDEKGYLFVESLFSLSDVAAYAEEITRMTKDPQIRGSDRTITEPEADEVRSIFEVHRSSDVFRDLVKEARVADIARQLLGSDVYVHQSRVNYKPGFKGKDFYWHSDFETWHCEDGMPVPRAVSVSILLTENHSYNGPLMIVPGSQNVYIQTEGETPEDHFRDSLKKQEVGVPSNDAMWDICNRWGIDVLTGPPGSVVFFESNAMHGSNGNITPFPRSNVFYVYNSVENTLVEPFAAPKPRPTFIGARDFTPVDDL